MPPVILSRVTGSPYYSRRPRLLSSKHIMLGLRGGVSMQRLTTCAFALAAGIGILAVRRDHRRKRPDRRRLDHAARRHQDGRMGPRRRKQLADGGRRARCRQAHERRRGSSCQQDARTRTSRCYVEFWASDDANSGIFIRCQNPKQITDRSCYEVNIFDQRPGPDLRHRRDRAFRRGEPDAQGRRQVEHLRDHRQGPA